MNLNDIRYKLHYYGDDGSLESTIVAVIAKLPPDVQEFVGDRCRFLSVGRVCWGMTMRQMICEIDAKEVEDKWLILLEEQTPAEQIESVVAHEIAHAWLGHDRYDPDLLPECEVEAALLTREWGFEGWGADPERARIWIGKKSSHSQRGRIAK